MSSPTDKHHAAVLSRKGKELTIIERETPTPGPNEVVIQVNSIALNPVDHIQQSMGFRVPSYPYILGFDVSGTISSIGSAVATLKVGDRVAALATSWFDKLPQFGAYQSFVLVPAIQVTLIPSTLPFNEASILPLALYTAWFALDAINVSRDVIFEEKDKKAILIWGVGGSVGSVALQIAKSLGFNVYATASSKHHSYLQELGKGPGKVRLFDYKDKDVVKKIVTAVSEDGLLLDIGIEAAAGNLPEIISILNKTKGNISKAKIASAPFSFSMLWHTMIFPSFFSGVIVKFVNAPEDPVVRNEYFSFIFNNWLPKKLQSEEFIPSPKVQVVGSGLASLQIGLVELKKGVSGVKLVVEV